MTYILEAIRTYLLAQGYTNIFIDYAGQDTTESQLTSRIVLMSGSGSVQNIKVPTQLFRFTVYVRDNNRKTASDRARAIYNLLQNYSFQSAGDNPVTVHQIQGNPPYFWGIFPKSLNASEFAIDMSALISNDDAVL